MSRAVYAYCIVAGAPRDLVERAPAGVPGGAGPRRIALADGIDVVIDDVDARAWSEEEIAKGLRDLDWVSERALRHEEIVTHFLDGLEGPHAALLPMKAFTIFRSEARALAHLRGREAATRAALDRVAGCVEWTARLRFDEQAARAARERATRRTQPSSGAAFLARKKQLADASRNARAEAIIAASAVVTRLAEAARAVQRVPAPEGAATALVGEAAYLVPRDARPALERIAEGARAELDGCGVTLELSGPWAPYHFAGETR